MYDGSVPPASNTQGASQVRKKGHTWALKEGWAKYKESMSWHPPNQIRENHVQTYGSVRLVHVPGDFEHLCPRLLQVERPRKCLALDPTVNYYTDQKNDKCAFSPVTKVYLFQVKNKP